MLRLIRVADCRGMLVAIPGVSWGDIAGLAEAKQVLQENVVLSLFRYACSILTAYSQAASLDRGSRYEPDSEDCSTPPKKHHC